VHKRSLARRELRKVTGPGTTARSDQ
jgi:hypothetical protein